MQRGGHTVRAAAVRGRAALARALLLEAGDRRREAVVVLEADVALLPVRAVRVHLAGLLQAAVVVGDIRKRLKSVEGRIRPDAHIIDEQAAEISLQVKALAHLIGGHYQTVFSELYRRFGVSSYKLIRIEQYEAVLAFLDEWRQRAVGNSDEKE